EVACDRVLARRAPRALIPRARRPSASRRSHGRLLAEPHPRGVPFVIVDRRRARTQDRQARAPDACATSTTPPPPKTTSATSAARAPALAPRLPHPSRRRSFVSCSPEPCPRHSEAPIRLTCDHFAWRLTEPLRSAPSWHRRLPGSYANGRLAAVWPVRQQ